MAKSQMLNDSLFQPQGITRFIIPKTISKGQVLKIYFIGDTHLGKQDVDLARIRYFVRQIRDDPNAYWIGMGDYIDAISTTDKRFAIKNLDNPNLCAVKGIITLQTETFWDVFSPIKDKCIGLLTGNHEEKFNDRSGIDFYVQACEKFATTIVGYSGYFIINCQRSGLNTRDFAIFAHHGFGGGHYIGGNVNKLERLLAQARDADCVAMGHVHQVGAAYRSQFRYNKNYEIIYQDIPLILTGTWAMQSWRCWEQTKGFPPAPRKNPCLLYMPFQSSSAQPNVQIII